MNKLLSFTFLFSITTFFYASAQTDKGVIRGKIVEEIGGLPIPYAVVAVSEGNSEIPLQTIQTTETGIFRIERLKLGIYRIKVSYVGYNNVILNSIEVSSSNFEVNIGAIKLSTQQSNLNEVIITGEKPLIENDGDVLVYNVGSSIYAEGSSAVDILKDVPMVEVDIDGKPSISGMRSTRIFINGRPSDYMTSNITDLLNVLPSDAVEKIEVMTNPPAKYSGDGEGVINIILRKDFKVGFNGNAGLGINTQGSKNFNTGASYRGKNYAINGGGTLRKSFSESANSTYRKNFPENTTDDYNQFSNTDGEGTGVSGRLGLDWDIDKRKKHNLKASTSYSNNGWDGLTTSNTHYLNNNQIEKRVRHQNNTANTGNNTFVFNTDYSLRLDTSGQKLDVHLTANTNNNAAYRIYDYKYTFPTNLSPYLQNNDNGISNRGINANIDYEKPFFNKRDRLEVGFALNIRENDNDQEVNIYNFKTNQFAKSGKLSSKFIYHEKIYAAYASYTYRTKEWTAKAAVRSEYTNVDFDLLNLEAYVVNPYLSVFPSMSVNRRIKKNINLGLSYGLRVNRPRENALNPQINNADTLNISYGNPNLTPSYTHQLAFNMGFYGLSWSFNPRITYSKATKVIERYRIVNPSGVSESTFDNVGSNYYLSYILVGTYRPTKTMSINGNFTFIQSSYSSALNKALNRDGYSIRARLGSSLQFSKQSAFEGSLNYANNLVAQGRNKSSISTSLGFRQNFLKNKLSARISAADPFRGKHTYSFSEATNFYAESFGKSNTNNFNLNLSYRFSKIKTNKITVPKASKVVGKPTTKKTQP